MNNWQVRAYRPSDLEACYGLFKATVQRVASKDYSPAQIQAWLGDDDQVTRQAWQTTLTAHVSLVAEKDGQLVGFGDMTLDGYLDRLYVHADFQKRGIGATLVNELERLVPTERYTTFASITARRFFEHQGYQVSYQNQVHRAGQTLINFKMVK